MRTLPRLWLMTDAARGDAAAAMTHLPHGAGVIFRHYDHPDRAALAAAWRALARRRRLIFLVAGDPHLAARVKADGFHAPEALAHRIPAARRLMPKAICTVAAHGARGIAAANALKADAVFLSPVFPTASHPGAPALGPLRATSLARSARMPVIALGGMTAARRKRLPGFAGYAAIAALQKLNDTSAKRMSASRSPT